MSTNSTDDRCFCDGAGYADEPEWCGKCTPEIEKPTLIMNAKGEIEKYRRVYPEAPKFSSLDIEGIRYEFNWHYNGCIHQNISCWMCELYIEHFKDMPEVQYVKIS